MDQQTFDRLALFSFYLLGFFLLWEWLRPLQELTDIGSMFVFITFLGLLFILYFFTVKIIWKSIVLVAVILWAIHLLHYNTLPFIGGQWITLFVTELINSMSMMIQQQWAELADSFRTLMFFLLLWMMTYLVHYWVVIRRNIFLFFIMSVLYVTILDTFTTFDGNWAIVRLFIMGFLLVGGLTFYRLIQRENITITKKQFSLYAIPLVTMILISSVIGFAAPKLSAQWPDPVPFIKTYSEKFQGNGEVVGRVGYDEDDSRLGGGFEEDDTVVFTAKMETRHNWKIETKNYYTGEGWENVVPNENIEELGFESGGKMPLTNVYVRNEDDETKVFEDTVNVEQSGSYIPYPDPITKGKINTSDTGAAFKYTLHSGLVNSIDESGGKVSLDQYKMSYQMPIYSVEAMRNAADFDYEEEGDFKQYVQLPSTVPERVKELAESITADEDNDYDKAKAIEDYFDKHEFTYDREDIPYPREGQDFVDQFLFETKRGYCDHFSTSMIVLLRSLGIPAKWVKGYTHGEFIKTEDGDSVYEVTNNNAHSWVEVYISSVGWIPFEPTKGFSNNTRLENDHFKDTPDSSPTENNQLNTPAPTPKKPVKNLDEPSATTKSSQVSITLKEQLSKHWEKIVGVLFGLVLLVVTLYISRAKWLPYVLLTYYKRKSSTDTMTNAYMSLLKQLQRCGINRKPEQTLREYSRYIDDYYSTNDMKKLTNMYEKVVYRGEDSVENWKQAQLIWEKIMKKTIT